MARALHNTGTIASRKAAVTRWRRRSAVVRFWRVFLPAAIVAIVVAISGWAIARGLLFQSEIVTTINDLRMLNGRFFGRDEHDRAFLVAAARAVSDPRDESKVALDNPTFNLGSGHARANRGIYDDKASSLILRGDVVIVDGEGGTIHTDEAQVDTKTGIITNTGSPQSKGIQIESDMGKISADDYTIARNGQVKFKGRVRGTINAK